MAFILVFSSGCLTCFATNGRIDDSEAYAVQSAAITFDADCVEIGKPITASVDYDGEIIYEWYVDGVKIAEDGNTFTPTEFDKEKIVTLRAFNSSKRFIGSRSVCISTLPVVYIETENRKDIKDKTEQNAYIKIQGNSVFKDSSVLYEGETTIKGRGNTTLLDAKKPFKLKLGSKADVLGMGKNKHWVLLSNPYDSSNIKNWVANTVSGEMGLVYQKSEPVTLIMNGKYAGTYYLCEHVRIGSERIDITDWDDEAESAAKAIYKANPDILTKDDRDALIDIMTENMDWVTDDAVEFNGTKFTVSDYYEIPDINGGYLMVIDKDQSYKSTNGVSIGVEKPEGIGSGMYDYITGYYQAFEDALYSDDFCTVYNGKKMHYSEFIDIDSFAKGIIVNEFGSNADFAFRSTYMYKDTDGLLTYGPVWDLDLAFGKSGISASADGYPIDYWKAIHRNIISRLCSDPYFLNRLRSLYWEYRYTAIADIFREGGLIDSEYERIKDAAYANDETWSYNETFDDAVKIVKRWASLRAEWLDTQFESLETIYKSMSKEFTKTYPVDDYIGTDDYVERLEITKIPDKLNYNHGDEIDLSGLELTAYFADGTYKTVEPTGVVSCAESFIGAKKTYINTVSDEDCDSIVVSLKYKNASADYKINAAPKEDSERVEELIKKCPNETGFNQRYLKEIFEAQAAYEALSENAKNDVSNYSRLEDAMKCVSAMAEETNSAIIGCYIDDNSLSRSKQDMVFVVKGEPSSIKWTLPEDKGTITFTPTKSTRSVKVVGGYTLWTVFALSQDFSAQVSYRPSQKTESFSFSAKDYNSTQDDIKKMTFTPAVILGDNSVMTFEAGTLIEKIIVKENGSQIVQSDSAENGKLTVNVPFENCGTHSLEIYFVSSGNEMYYKSADVLVREQPSEAESIPCGFVQNAVYDEVGDYENNYTVTVIGRAYKIQFVDDEGNSVTVSRTDIEGGITSYAADSEKCSDLSRMLDYEVWNFTMKIRPAHYRVVVKTHENEWEAPEYGFSIDISNRLKDSGVFSITASADTVWVMDHVTLTVVTDTDVSKLQIVIDDGTEDERTFSASDCAVRNGDTLVFTVQTKMYSRGDHTLRAHVKTSAGWLPLYDYSPSVVVTAK